MLRVIGAGFGRTGTASLKAALEQLGFGPCHHMLEVMQHPESLRRWLDAFDGRADWERLFDGYRAAVDWPSAHFWRQLSEVYPDAKVILTVRDPQRWYDSGSATIFKRMGWRQSLAGVVGHVLLTLANPRLARFSALLDRITRQVFDGDLGDRAHAIAVFGRHNARVKAAVPAERLLVYEVSQGWGPLCAFLEVPVPDGPFPHLNESKEFQERMRQGMVRGAAKLAAATLAATALLAALSRCRRRTDPLSARPTVVRDTPPEPEVLDSSSQRRDHSCSHAGRAQTGAS